MTNLTDDQKLASEIFTQFMLDETAKFMVIQGAAGTGKSFLVNYILQNIKTRMRLYSLLLGGKDEEITPYDIVLTATTNKAAAVLADFTQMEARTIYSFLHLAPCNNYKTGEIEFIPSSSTEIIYNSIIIVDECSFISDELFKYIDTYTSNCKILLIGDQYQLVPVGQKELVMNQAFRYRASLKKVMRHGGAIAKQGAKFRDTLDTGIFTPITVNGKNIIHADADTFKNMIDSTFTDPSYSSSTARVLAWRNDIVRKYNDYIRVLRGAPILYTVDDVLITNKPIIYKRMLLKNTDATVKISEICEDTVIHGVPGRMVILDGNVKMFLPNVWTVASKVIASFKRKHEMSTYFQLQNEWLDLRPGFSSTVHKSQGSTYDTVFINLSDIACCPIPSDVARMLYVAISRAAKRVVLNGYLPIKYTRGSYAIQ